jgi:hypothetical protein
MIGDVVQMGFCFLIAHERWVGNSVQEHILSGLGTSERCGSDAVVVVVCGMVCFTVEV